MTLIILRNIHAKQRIITAAILIPIVTRLFIIATTVVSFNGPRHVQPLPGNGLIDGSKTLAASFYIFLSWLVFVFDAVYPTDLFSWAHCVRIIATVSVILSARQRVWAKSFFGVV